MNKLSYRIHHIVNFLKLYSQQHLPLDLFLSFYFKEHKALGSKDRAEIAETIYGVIRWKSLLEFLSSRNSNSEFGHIPNWQELVLRYQEFNPLDSIDDQSIPLPQRVAFPPLLFEFLKKDYGEDRAKELCLICNTPAPTTIRVNTLKTTRDSLLEKWKDQFCISPCQVSESGILFKKKIHFFSLPEFKEGLFEIQDEGSQLLANLVGAEPGQLVMDYCSGSGGKTLAFAPKMKHKGQIYLHDIRERALFEAKKRLKRAGIQNAQIIFSNAPHLKQLKKKMDWVLVDAPCSGTGTLRRNPDMKWKFDEKTLPELVMKQREIFEQGLSYLKPSGRIVYATCSLLKEENEVQISHFTKTYGLEVDGEFFHSLPAYGEMDGFFGAVLKVSRN